MWAWADGQSLLRIPAHHGGADAVAFSPDQQIMVTSGRDNAVKCWRLSGSDPLFLLQAHEKPVLALGFNAAGTLLATGSGDNTVRLWAVGE
jgi:WD40 repeat protein